MVVAPLGWGSRDAGTGPKRGMGVDGLYDTEEGPAPPSDGGRSLAPVLEGGLGVRPRTRRTLDGGGLEGGTEVVVVPRPSAGSDTVYVGYRFPLSIPREFGSKTRPARGLGTLLRVDLGFRRGGRSSKRPRRRR